MSKKKGLSRTARFWMMMCFIAIPNAAFIVLQCTLWNASKYFTLNTDAVIWISAVGGVIIFLVTANAIIGATSVLLGEDPVEEEIIRHKARHTMPVDEPVTITPKEPDYHPETRSGNDEFLRGFVTGSVLATLVATLLRRR